MVSDSPIKTSFSTLCAMPYDPEEEHRASLERAQADPSPRDDILPYETTWKETASSPPLFDNASWNHHNSSLMLLLHSSDITDGLNNGFDSLVSCRNPTIWSFLECARKETSHHGILS